MCPKNAASRNILAAGLAILSLAFVPQDAKAIPELQIYLDGATYDTASETWVLSNAGSFQLWVIGNVSGPGGKGSIYDVKLSAAVATSESGGVALTPTTTSLLTDPSTPSAPGPNGLSADGAVPLLGDGTPLPTHGIYGPGTSFYEWTLGDFTLTDSPMADFIGTYPSVFYPGTGQINAYNVSVSGYTTVHFDAYNHYFKQENDAKYVKAPFSHDGEVSAIPEPETYAMLGIGLGLMGFVARRRKQQATTA